MIVYACMCEQMLDCEYVMILKLCVGALQFSLLFDESLLLLHKTLAVFQITMQIFDILIVGPLLLIHSDSFSLQPRFEKQYQPCMISWWACQQNKVQCSVQLGDFKCDRSFPRRLYWGHNLLWQLQPIPSPSPLSNLQSLRVEQTSSNVKHCEKSKISLIILSKWNVCLCSFSVILLTVRADCETKF